MTDRASGVASVAGVEAPGGDHEGVRPTVAPLIVALGVFFGLWGVQASWIFSAFGAATFVAGMWIWLREVSRQWRTQS